MAFLRTIGLDRSDSARVSRVQTILWVVGRADKYRLLRPFWAEDFFAGRGLTVSLLFYRRGKPIFGCRTPLPPHGVSNGHTSNQAQRLHAAGEHPHRRLALSGRVAG